MDNLRVSIKRIHIRFEDAPQVQDLECMAYSCNPYGESLLQL